MTLYPDVAAKAKQGAARLGKPFKEIVNEALRIGLDRIMQPPTAKPYRTRPHPMGLRPGLSCDNTGELLACADAEAGAFGSRPKHRSKRTEDFPAKVGRAFGVGRCESPERRGKDARPPSALLEGRQSRSAKTVTPRSPARKGGR